LALLCFGSSLVLARPAALLLFAVYALLAAALSAAAFRRLNPEASLDLLLAPPGGRAWGAAAFFALAAFYWAALSPLAPGRLLGVLCWPRPFPLLSLARHALLLGGLGAVSAALAGREGLAGRLDRFEPYGDAQSLSRLALLGLLLGLAAAAAGACAHRWTALSPALALAGQPFLSRLVLWAQAPLLAAALAASLLWLSGERPFARRPLLSAALVLLLWGGGVLAAGAWLGWAFDYGRASLGEAAGLEDAPRGESAVLVVVLAAPDGTAGTRSFRVREEAEGAAVSPENLRRVRGYLERRAYRTVFLREALRFLREGHALVWDLEPALDAAMVRLGPAFPPDWEAFLALLRSAPCTPANYRRLDSMSRAALRSEFPQASEAERVYSGFAAAFARFGDKPGAELWLGKRQGLYPLVRDEPKLEPVQSLREGRLSGRLLLSGAPAASVKVGLFRADPGPGLSPSFGARGGLAAACYPDEKGRFAFEGLSPGVYYLALRGDPRVLGSPARARAAPGALRLSPGRPAAELPAIEVRP